MKLATAFLVVVFLLPLQGAIAQEITADDLAKVKALESARIEAIKKAMPSVVAIYGEDRQGGGSGVLIHPNGLALTNHHVILGAGVSGWGGLADGNLYRWDLIGTDPGGDVSLIQLHGKDVFPFSELADSDKIKVGDWAMAMGNPFLLTEDQTPTVTLGIVSGIKRYQPGEGQNQLIYGNCIQIDSSINPGNSGGPLFDLNARIMGINGRGSFLDRGRVNVGLGYAISANQIKNFLPDLLATKLVEHGSLDASFSNLDGRVVCSTINELSRIADAGLALGDRLLEFEGEKIESANQFTNLICTLPEDWPANLLIEKKDGSVQRLVLRLLGLPYSRPPLPPPPEKPTPEQQKQLERQKQMFELLRADPGTVRDFKKNREFAATILTSLGMTKDDPKFAIKIRMVDDIVQGDKKVGTCITTLTKGGEVEVSWQVDGQIKMYEFVDGSFSVVENAERRELSTTEAKLSLPLVQALGIHFANSRDGFGEFGDVHLDASDKSNGQVCARMKYTDKDDDWFYVWVTMADPSRGVLPQLIKASAELDCDNKRGGFSFANWQNREGWQVPLERKIVSGLEEKTLFVLFNQSVEKVADSSPGEATESSKADEHSTIKN